MNVLLLGITKLVDQVPKVKLELVRMEPMMSVSKKIPHRLFHARTLELLYLIAHYLIANVKTEYHMNLYHQIDNPVKSSASQSKRYHKINIAYYCRM